MDLNKDLELQKEDVPLARFPSLDAFTARVEGIRSVKEDLAVINSEIGRLCVCACLEV